MFTVLNSVHFICTGTDESNSYYGLVPSWDFQIWKRDFHHTAAMSSSGKVHYHGFTSGCQIPGIRAVGAPLYWFWSNWFFCFFSSAHQRAYIFQRRPRTPPKYPKQEEYLKELTKQVCSPQCKVHYCRFEFCVHALSILAHGVHQYEFQWHFMCVGLGGVWGG